MLMDTITAFRVKKTPFHDLSDEAPATPPASSHSLILSLSPPHVGGILASPATGPLPKLFSTLGIVFFSMHPWDIRVSIPSSGAASPEFCVQTTITVVHRLYNPLCSNNHNCDLMMVCVVIWQNFIRAETLIFSCSSWKTSVSSIILAHVYTTIFVSREKTEWITDRLVHIPCLEEAQVQWHKWHTMGSLLQVSYKAETRTNSHNPKPGVSLLAQW